MSKLYFLSLMTLSYIVGELTHFLINTTSREVAREVEFGEKSCFVKSSFVRDVIGDKEENDCTEFKNETNCVSENHCYWEYSGLGIQYQVIKSNDGYDNDGNCIIFIWPTCSIFLLSRNISSLHYIIGIVANIQ